MRRVISSAVIVLAVAGALTRFASAAPAPSPSAIWPELADIVLAQDNSTLPLASVVRAHRLTVVVFVSSTCPCLAAHRARLAALVQEMEPRDVHFVLVDPERHPPGEAQAAVLAEVDLPIWRDKDAQLARRLGARTATETFVLDAAGLLRYRGGIDDDRKALRATPKEYLHDQLIGLLDGTAAPYFTAKALGCVLRLR